ncbi:brassinosteroid-6-oxidase [Cinnamomum micranthum f. kanehirae]|uniref:Brassinosteroid-6-oxidase n=1 Tax=Cinnamomum micranthum f. kanehirae TaxID=337451 RepID=A0A443N5Q3_9MAGN|nr:brassinosteroid-6-oxidase [Cinnamomum micranthum f. kanehirae]
MVFLGVVFIGVILVLCVCTALLRWNEVKYRKKGLPPGTMGWPVFGETTEFLKQGPSFMKNQRARYGSLFRSHILGCPTVVSMDPELNRYILMNEGKGLLPGYPQSMLTILGECNIASVHGPLHKDMRGAMLSLISPPIIRDQLLPKIDQFMRSHLSNWNDKIINIQEKTKEMALLSSLKQIGIESNTISEFFIPEFYKLVLGTLSLPIDLPGTNYRRAIQARKKILIILKEIIEERRASKSNQNDMLDSLLRIDESSKLNLTDQQIIDLIITLLYSGYETVSTTSMMVVKYLHDHPRVLEELRNEHLEVRKRKAPEDPIDWNDYRSMSFTRAVILETMRIATIVNGVLRKTTQDMEMKGFVIPKGWKIYVYTREINYDPFLYPEPLTFNPWRWQDKRLESQQYFLMFGGGSRQCPGKELGIVEITTFIHYFVTRYRWEEVGGDTLLKFPRVEAPNGLHLRVWNY